MRFDYCWGNGYVAPWKAATPLFDEGPDAVSHFTSEKSS
jgi:hypothetical protein